MVLFSLVTVVKCSILAISSSFFFYFLRYKLCGIFFSVQKVPSTSSTWIMEGEETLDLMDPKIAQNIVGKYTFYRKKRLLNQAFQYKPSSRCSTLKLLKFYKVAIMVHFRNASEITCQ